MFKKNTFWHVCLKVKKHCLYELGSYELASVTEEFFLWQKLLWVAEIYFCYSNCLCVSLMKTETEICFCDENYFLKKKKKSSQNFFWKKLVSVTIKNCLWRKFDSVTECFSVTLCLKHSVLGIFYMISKEMFFEKCEFRYLGYQR